MTKDKSHPDPRQGGRDQYRRHVDGDIRVSGQLEVHAPPDTVKGDNSHRKDEAAYRKRNFIVSLMTLLAVVIYAGLTAWQGCSTKKATDAAASAATTADATLKAS